MMVTRPRGPATLARTFDGLRADYDMSRENRFMRRRTGLAPQGNSADWHYRSEEHYYRDIEKARDMDRNDSIVGQTIDRAVANIIQDGFRLDFKTGDKSVDADLLARWNDWANDPEQVDVAGEFCWHDFELHSTRAMLVDGDCVNLAIDSGHLQHLEAHTIQTSTRQENTFLGVTRDETGRHVKYWVITDPIDPRRGTKETSVPVDVRNELGQRVLFHVYRPKRMSQTRGVTSFAPIFATSGMCEDIQFAKLVQQQVVSCFAIFRKRAYIPDLPGNTTPGYGSSETESQPDGGVRQLENIAPGMELIGQPGEELQGFSPQVPNAEYFQHFRQMLQIIGVNLGLPLCLVLMDGSETNFSGWRGAVDEARKGFRINQRNIVDRLHTPVTKWKVTQWIATDRVLREASKRLNLFAHKWHPPSWQYIDPVGDAQGDALRWQNALSSPRRIQAERGGDGWDTVAAEIVEDHALAILQAKRRAAAINADYPDDPPVHWRELINLPMPNGVQMTMQDPNLIEARTLDQRDAAESLQRQASQGAGNGE